MAINRTRRPQNLGANRNRAMRNNARRPGTFQGQLGLNQGAAPQGVGQPPVQGGQSCPPGQQPGRDPVSGAQTCVPARANIAGNVPINNGDRAIASGPKGNMPPKGPRGY